MKAPFSVQHELFPLDPLEPEPAAVRAPAPDKRPPRAAPVPEDDRVEEIPEPEEAPALPPTPEDRARRPFPTGLFAAVLSALSLSLALVALIVGLHAAHAPGRPAPAAGEDAMLARLAGLAAGVDPATVALDGRHKRLQARAIRIPGAELATYQALEQRVQAQAPGWTVTITPPVQPVPTIRFADGRDDVSDTAKRAVRVSAWAAQRWGFASLGVPGLIAPGPDRPLLPQRRAQAVASLLAGMGIRATPLPAEGPAFRLRPPWPQQQ